jgi:multiple sugar transport system ATP-binding protein
MANVDAKIRTSMRAQLKTIQKTLGKYVIYSTPDPVEVFALADKVCVMNQGQVFQFDTPDEVYKHPVNLTTAVRFGSPAMNTYSCHLVEKGNGLTLEAKDFKLDVRSLRETLKKSPSKDLVIGLRPENLRIADGKEKPDFVLPAKIFGYEITGSDTIVYVRVGEALMSVFVPSIYEPVLDSDVRICFDMDALYFFQETGEPVR